MVNKVTLIDRLGKDPEVRILETGTNIAKFPLATDESFKNKKDEWQTQTEWHNIIMWRDLAEHAGRLLKKGYLVYIEGKLTSRSWQDENGTTKYITEVRANSFRLLKSETKNGASEEAKKEDPKNNPHIVNVANEPDDLPF